MNIFQNKYILTAVLGAVCPLSLLAQTRGGNDSTFKSQQLNFYSTYKPEVAPAPKPEFIPSLPIVDTSKPVLQYVVPEQSFSYAYKAEPIKPVALKREQEKLPFENYAKLGIGSQNTFLIDAGLGSLVGNNYDATVHFNHFSQKGKFVDNQKWSQNTLDAASNIYMDKATLSLGLQADRRAYRQYGYDNDLYTFNDKDIRNVYSGVLFNAALTPISTSFWNIKYRPEARFYWWNSRMDASERNIDLSVPLSKDIDSNFNVSLAVNFGLTNYSSKASGGFGNNYLQFHPAVNFTVEGFKARVGLKPTFGSTDNYLLPDISVSGKILNNTLNIYAGWEGKLNQNTYRTLSLFNPYMQSDYKPMQGRESHIFGGFNASLSKSIAIGGTVGYKMWKNMALYQNNYAASPDGRAFEIIYADMKALVIDAHLQYQINEQFSISGRNIWNLYSTDLIRAQQLPQMELKGGFQWRITDKFRLGADINLYDRIFARQKDLTYQKLPMIVDLNANVSYDVHKRISLFLNVDNILNQRYQYWNQYRTLGFTIYGGLRFKF